MSSHHFVREGQEPALLILQYTGFSYEYLGHLLEWAPTVISCGRALADVLALGIKTDWALYAPTDEASYEKALGEQEPVRRIVLGEHEFLGTALRLLREEQCGAVNIVTTEDQLYEVAQQALVHASGMRVVVYTPNYRTSLMLGPTFRKWLPAGSHIRIGVLSEPAHFASRGFDNDGQMGQDGMILRVAQTGMVEVTCFGSPFLVSEWIGVES